MITFYAFIPLLKNKVGHIYSYHLAVAKAVESNGWHYKALVAKSCEIQEIPFDHEELFRGSNWEKNRALFHKIIKPLFGIGKLFRFLRKIEPQESVLFLESFFPGHFFALVIALFLLRKRFTFLVVHRYSPHDPKYAFAYYVYAFFQKLLKRKARLILLTDTEGLAAEQRQRFDHFVHLLPIPHHMQNQREHDPEKIICWWPGGSVRIDKGLEHICRLAKDLGVQNKKNMVLVLAESAGPYLPCVHEGLNFIPKNLSEQDYESWMYKANIILLPYLPGLYRERSSGIFVEAICSGAMPVSTDDTWIAYELKRFDLQELVINWHSPTLIEDIVKLSQNAAVKEKLKRMRQEYQRVHSIENYGHVLKEAILFHHEKNRRYLVRHFGIPSILRLIDAALSLLKIQRVEKVEAPKKILLCNGAHLGDLINATAVLPVIRKAFPKAQIGFLVGSWSRQVIEGHPDITWIHEFDHWKINRTGKRISSYIKTWRRCFSEISKIRYDVCIDLYAFFGNTIPLIFCCKIPMRIGFTSGGFSPLLTNPVTWRYDGMAIVSSFVGLLKELPVKEENLSLLAPSLPPISSQPLRQDNYVILHPGSGAEYKAWPIEHWRTLALQLKVKGYTVVVTGNGQSEREMARLLVAEEHNYCGKLSWKEFTLLVKGAKFVFGVDSVIGHLAAALKIPSYTVLPGIHPPKEWLPYGHSSQVVRFVVPCSPCRLRRGCKKMTCVRKADPELILHQIEEAHLQKEPDAKEGIKAECLGK